MSNQPDKYGRYITKTQFGTIDLRYYNPDEVSNKFTVGERIEWVESVTDTEDGPTSIYQSGVIKKITSWTVLLEIDLGKGQHQEKRLDKAYLENRASSQEMKAAIQASMAAAAQDRYAREKFHPVPLVKDATSPSSIKQCFRCELYYARAAFESSIFAHQRSLILSETCPNCYQKTANKISTYNGLARKNGGQTGLTVTDWLEKLKASQRYCHYCKKQYSFRELIIEHIIPLSWGGDNTINNVVPACIGCNSSKGDRDHQTWQRHLEAQRLLEQLQEHLGLSAFEVKNLAIKKLAEALGITIETNPTLATSEESEALP